MQQLLLDFDRMCSSLDQLKRETDELTKIYADNIEPDMYRQAQAALAMGTMAAVAGDQLKQYKLHIEREVLPSARERAERLLNSAGQKITISGVDSKADAQPIMVRCYKALLEYELALAILTKAEGAMWQRKDMLQSINSRNRQELGTLQDDLEHQKQIARNRIQSSQLDPADH